MSLFSTIVPGQFRPSFFFELRGGRRIESSLVSRLAIFVSNRTRRFSIGVPEKRRRRDPALAMDRATLGPDLGMGESREYYRSLSSSILELELTFSPSSSFALLRSPLPPHRAPLLVDSPHPTREPHPSRTSAACDEPVGTNEVHGAGGGSLGG